MDNCLVFITHDVSLGISNYLNYIASEIKGIMDFIVLYDNSKCSINQERYSNILFFQFNSSNINNFFHRGDKRLPNPLIPLLDLAKTYKYKHYLIMENDIILKGSFKEFVQRISSIDSVDYIHIAKDYEGDSFSHWPINFIEHFKYAKIYFSWCQIFYCSYNFLSCIRDEFKKNESVYYEFLLPSIAYNLNFSVKQFENYGYDFHISWGPKELYESLFRLENCRNTFYHPIKQLDGIDFNSLRYY